MAREVWRDVTGQLGTVPAGETEGFVKSLCRKVGEVIPPGESSNEVDMFTVAEDILEAIEESLDENPEIDDCCDRRELEEIYRGRR